MFCRVFQASPYFRAVCHHHCFTLGMTNCRESLLRVLVCAPWACLPDKGNWGKCGFIRIMIGPGICLTGVGLGRLLVLLATVTIRTALVTLCYSADIKCLLYTWAAGNIFIRYSCLWGAHNLAAEITQILNKLEYSEINAIWVTAFCRSKGGGEKFWEVNGEVFREAVFELVLKNWVKVW